MSQNLLGGRWTIEFITDVIVMASKNVSEMKLNQMMNDLKESGFLYSCAITEGELEQARQQLFDRTAPCRD